MGAEEVNEMVVSMGIDACHAAQIAFVMAVFHKVGHGLLFDECGRLWFIGLFGVDEGLF